MIALVIVLVLLVILIATEPGPDDHGRGPDEP